MSGLAEAIRYHAAVLDAARPQPRFGVIESVDAGRHLAKVTIQPEGVLSGWLPILGLGGGGGWGIVCPPAIGAQVIVIPLDGDHESWGVLGAAWSTANLPPAPAIAPGGGNAAVNPGEMAIVSAAGACIRLNADGSVTMASPVTMTLAAPAIVLDGNTTINGTLTQTAGDEGGAASMVGPLTVINDATIEGRGFMEHRHSGVQAGGGNTGVPV